MAKKKYSIDWEDDLPVSFEVNGVQYETLEDVPDEGDRRKLEAMLDSSFDADFNDAEFEQLQKETQQINGVTAEKISVWVFTGVAALMLMIAGISTVTTLQKLGREESVPGIVVEVVERKYVDAETDNVSYYYYPVVDFKPKDGKRRTIQLNEGSNPPSQEVGDEVTILYEPEHPSDARIKSFGSSALMWILPSITGIVGFGFLGAVLVVQKYLFSPTSA
ncbi:MAG: DUF3592 domain-containing protein [Chloroflexi bacterium]|nr:DUF3592 domain-containing protein [Chloroflexota bacterium]